MAGRDGDVPDPSPDEEEDQDEEEPSPNPDPDPEPDPNPEPAPPPKRGRPKLTKEEILKRLSSKAKAKVTSTPQTRSTKGTKEGLRPVAGVDISSLIKVPTFELEAKAKTNPKKSVQITEELESESDIDEDLESTRVPRFDRDFNPRDLDPRHPGSPEPGADPEAAFRSGIGRDHVQDEEAFSTVSRAVIEKLR
jgi:hypothetical protein